MANTVYDNFYLSNEVEDQLNSRLDLLRFCTHDASLEGTAGMKRIINVYSATNGTEKLAQGEGNTKSIEVGFTQREYEILLAQNRFTWYDEEAMKDPMIVPTGMKHAGVDLFNTLQADVFAEFKKATLSVTATTPNLDAFADARAKLNLEEVDGIEIFAHVNANMLAKIRKAVKDDLKYVEAFVRSGYVGTICGINLYDKQDADDDAIYVGTKKAVTMFTKKGVEIEQERDANIRKNDAYSRKYYIPALTDETQVVKLAIGA
jgi:hypothetical protein